MFAIFPSTTKTCMVSCFRSISRTRGIISTTTRAVVRLPNLPRIGTHVVILKSSYELLFLG